MKMTSTYIALLILLLVATGITLLYFAKADLEGEALMNVCACGYRRVHLSKGVIKLAEPNHDRKTGDIVGLYNLAGTNITILSGTNAFTVTTTRDHLGLRDVKPSEYREHYLLTHKWKAYIHAVWNRITR